MAFLNKLFGKKDKNKKEDEELRENGAVDTEDGEPIDLDSLMDGEDELTEEEIAAAEKFEEEHKEEYENVTPLDYDGDFIDFEGLAGEDPEEIEETEERSEEESEEAVDEPTEEIAEESEAEADDEEEPEEKISFWEKLKNGLSKTKKALFGSVNDLLKNFVKAKRAECAELSKIPHPAEFDKYYNL